MVMGCKDSVYVKKFEAFNREVRGQDRRIV